MTDDFLQALKQALIEGHRQSTQAPNEFDRLRDNLLSALSEFIAYIVRQGNVTK